MVVGRVLSSGHSRCCSMKIPSTIFPHRTQVTKLVQFEVRSLTKVLFCAYAVPRAATGKNQRTTILPIQYSVIRTIHSCLTQVPSFFKSNKIIIKVSRKTQVQPLCNRFWEGMMSSYRPIRPGLHWARKRHET